MVWLNIDETSPVVEKYPDIPWLFSRFEDDDDATNNPTGQPGQPVSPDAACILVVDDDLANLALAEALLQAEGFQVRVAIDGASMFQALKTCAPSLILMDIQLPEVDGWELTRRLKADPATSGIPVIAITATRTIRGRLEGPAGRLCRVPVQAGQHSRAARHHAPPPGRTVAAALILSSRSPCGRRRRASAP